MGVGGAEADVERGGWGGGGGSQLQKLNWFSNCEVTDLLGVYLRVVYFSLHLACPVVSNVTDRVY